MRVRHRGPAALPQPGKRACSERPLEPGLQRMRGCGESLRRARLQRRREGRPGPASAAASQRVQRPAAVVETGVARAGSGAGPAAIRACRGVARAAGRGRRRGPRAGAVMGVWLGRRAGVGVGPGGRRRRAAVRPAGHTPGATRPASRCHGGVRPTPPPPLAAL